MWSIDAFSFFSPADKVRDEQSFPFHMYRPPLLNIEYPLSLSTLRLSAMTLRGYGETDLDHLDVWDDQFEFNEAAALSAWHGNCASFKQKYDPGGAFPETLLRQLQDSVERNLAIVIRANPSVSFDLVLPPISTLSYYEPGSSLFTYVPFREALGKLLRYPNVRLHDLQIASEITNDLSNYKDLLHFNRAATEFMIDAVRDRRVLVADENTLRRNTDRLAVQVNDFDLCRNGVPAALAGR